MVEKALCIFLLKGQQNLMHFGKLRSAMDDLRQLNRNLFSRKIVVNLQVGENLWLVIAEVNATVRHFLFD